MKYNFDEAIDRRNTNSLSVEGFRDYIRTDENLKFPYKDEEMIRMWVADMDFAVPPCVVEAMEQCLKHRIFGYTSIFDPAYYDAFNNWSEKRYGWHFERDHLVTSNGIVSALFELLGNILKQGDKILIFTPSYACFKYAADFHSAECVCSDLINERGFYRINFDDFENKAKDPAMKICIFCNPHNPSGRVWTEEELRRVGEICLKNDMWIISDEIHCDLLRMGQRHIPFAKIFPNTDRIITCTSASKTFNLAGLMMSNIFIPNEELRKKWMCRHCYMDNPLSIAATQAAYQFGGDWLDQVRTYLDDNYKLVEAFLRENLPKAVFQIPEATYLAWVNVGEYLSEQVNMPLYFAQKAGVLLEGGNAMFVQNAVGYIRLNCACPRAVLKNGLIRIAGALN